MRTIQKVVAFLLPACVAFACQADVAQEPLLNRPRSVPPNLMLVIDTSGSMLSTLSYEYGNPTPAGPEGPYPSSTGSGPGCGIYPCRSPQINKMAYDPRVRYEPRTTLAGQPLPNTGTVWSTWQVYFSRIGSGPYETGDIEWADTPAYYVSAYPPPASEVVPGSTASYPAVVNTATLPPGTLFPKFRERTDCVQRPDACTLQEEKDNYNNYNFWYSSRIAMVNTAIAKVLSEVPDDVVRVGVASYGEMSNWFGPNMHLGVGVSKLDASQRARIDQWISTVRIGGDTPTRTVMGRVGQYFERKDSDGPWATVPNPASTSFKPTVATGPGSAEPESAHASCRRSYAMLFTDGYWNDKTTGADARPKVGNVDGTGFTISRNPSPPYVYTPMAPYADLQEDTLADVAMSLWGRDLRPDLPNRVSPLSRPANPSTWQNLTFYAVALGLPGSLPQTPAMLAELSSGIRPWPVPVPDKPSTIDDMWHATLNGRGEMLTVKNSREVTGAFRRIINDVVGSPHTLSGVAVSSAYLRAGTRKYKPQYVPGEWAGMLSAIALDAATGNERNPPTIYWQVEKGPAPDGSPVTTIPDHAARNVVTWSSMGGVNFDAAGSGLNADLVNYVRGDASQEFRNGGYFRNRAYRLGDIVNSNPVFIKEGTDFAYEKLVGNFGDYRNFVAAKAARPEGVVFVGANDGMLHGFRDSDGAEVFAYVPRAVYPDLSKLTLDPYPHHYFVDGPLTDTDAYLGGTWKNLLLGTTGAGAKAVFALDVTNPTALGASKMLWEVSSTTTGFANLGNVVNDVQAGITRSNDWVALFGNGVNSSSGAASLYVVNLATGSLIREIVVPAGGGNGLVGLRAVYDAERRLVGAYGGDLQGNLWKFDLTGASGTWQVALGGQPLFAAGATQPITAAPAVVPHEKGGSMVIFGTGKMLESADIQGPFKRQRAYGVWDTAGFGTSGGSPAPLSSLVQQVITPVQIGTPPTTYFQITRNTVNYAANQRGWYMDLDSGDGQRVIYPLQRVSDGFVLLSTLSPVSATPPDVCTPSGSGSGWVYLINAFTGSGPEKPAFDTSLDGSVSVMDAVVAGYVDAVDGRPTSIDIGTTKSMDRLCIESADSQCIRIELSCGQAGAKACPTANASGLKSRQWRQIFPR
ncbi:hypothetical protein EZ216_14280 [Ramlibacter humi]|uniref:PilY1 beta-propeller domain-containing protein n=2 Tax=Ramlibacter humi TaxID=2530451 RepID=A0A4Z0BLR8_9BURK|nr:hypothetical protein EZ216_14280 [Ramlibacter humi]